MHKNILETLMGAIVLVVAGAFLVFAYEGSQTRVEQGYVVTARFGNATGIALGSDIRIGGIKIGSVTDMKLDPDTYQAIVSLQLRKGVEIPKDSSASIASSGLLGDKYVQITPGGDDMMLKAGEKIEFTQSSVNLEEMIGKFMFSGGGVDKGGNKSTAKPDAAPTASKEAPADDSNAAVAAPSATE